MNLYETITDYLRAKGYREVEPEIWESPYGSSPDRLIPTILECLEQENLDPRREQMEQDIEARKQGRRTRASIGTPTTHITDYP